MEKMLTTKEVAEHLGLHVKTVRYYCLDGILPATKVGKNWYILASSVDELLRPDKKERSR